MKQILKILWNFIKIIHGGLNFLLWIFVMLTTALVIFLVVMFNGGIEAYMMAALFLVFGVPTLPYIIEGIIDLVSYMKLKKKTKNENTN